MKRLWILPWAVALSTSPHHCTIIDGGIACSTQPFYQLTYNGKPVETMLQDASEGKLIGYAEQMNESYPLEKPSKLERLPI